MREAQARQFHEVASFHDDKAAWLRARSSGIGASEAPAVVGVDDWSNALEVWGRKRGLIDEAAESEAMFWGKAHEPTILQVTAQRCGLPVAGFGIMVRHAEHDFVMATPDGVFGGLVPTEEGDWIPTREYNEQLEAREGPVRTPLPIYERGDELCRECRTLWEDLGPGLVEAKSTGVRQAARWRGPEGEAAAPMAPRVQLLQQLFVTGAQWGILVVLIGGNRWSHTHHTLETLGSPDDLLAIETRFWRDNVLAGVAPIPDGSEVSSEALAAVYPKAHEGQVVDLPREAITLHLERLQALEDLRLARDAADLASNRLKALIGEASYGRLPQGFGKLSWLHEPREAYTVKANPDLRVLRHLKPRR
jgi:predicted phage-related endonuclease